MLNIHSKIIWQGVMNVRWCGDVKTNMEDSQSLLIGLRAKVNLLASSVCTIKLKSQIKHAHNVQ